MATPTRMRFDVVGRNGAVIDHFYDHPARHNKGRSGQGEWFKVRYLGRDYRLERLPAPNEFGAEYVLRLGTALPSTRYAPDR